MVSINAAYKCMPKEIKGEVEKVKRNRRRDMGWIISDKMTKRKIA